MVNFDSNPFCSGCPPQTSNWLKCRWPFDTLNITSLSCMDFAEIIIALYCSGGSRNVISFMPRNTTGVNLLSPHATFAWNTTSRSAIETWRVAQPCLSWPLYVSELLHLGFPVLLRSGSKVLLITFMRCHHAHSHCLLSTRAGCSTLDVKIAIFRLFWSFLTVWYCA